MCGYWYDTGMIENPEVFWKNAAEYTNSVDEDAPFVEEMAYMMVTIHRSGT